MDSDFSLSGPSHPTRIDWTNADYQRSVAACLVQGVYVLERDRQEEREGSRALAPPWWESFHFKLSRPLVDDADRSIFGAIYKYEPPSSHYNDSIEQSPGYVIAFRGTLLEEDSICRDVKLNIRLILNRPRTSCLDIGMQAVEETVATVGDSKVWLAGHSLGAAMAMLVGKTMAKTEIFLESFLFNPPFLSVPIGRIKGERVKYVIRIVRSVIIAGLACAVKAKNRNVSKDPFAALSGWFPCLFVNPADFICSEYVGYFEHRRNMEEIGAGGIEKLATKYSLRGLLMRFIGKGSEAAEPFYLIPSANLTVNRAPTEVCKNDHGIHQWWSRDLDLHSERYSYP